MLSLPAGVCEQRLMGNVVKTLVLSESPGRPFNQVKALVSQTVITDQIRVLSDDQSVM